MLNTETCYRFEVITQLAYFVDQSREGSWLWVKTNAFSSNLLSTGPQSVLLGTIVCGILTPTFGTHMTTQMESWTLSSAEDWAMHGIGGVPKPINFDIDPETCLRLPVLGGGAYDIASLRWALAGVRLSPPGQDPHLFHRKLAAERKKKLDQNNDPDTHVQYGRTVSVDPRGVDDVGYRRATKNLYSQVQRRGRRDESVLAAARRTHSQRREERRGRSPEQRRSRDPKYTDVGRKAMDPKNLDPNAPAQGP